MENCAQHALGGLVDVCSRKCRTGGCGKRSSFGVEDTKTVEYCAKDAPEGMVNVKNRKCRAEGCGKLPYFGIAGTKTGEYCAAHRRGWSTSKVESAEPKAAVMMRDMLTVTLR